jgi:1-acyl-sn-glycerol-3-phosphate acyltransferase
MQVQPVSIAYHAPRNSEARFYGWWGDMDFGPHFLAVLAAKDQGRVDVTYHPPLAVTAFSGRKVLAAACEDTVRAGHTALMARDASQDL